MSSKFFPSQEEILPFYQKGYAVPLAAGLPYRDPFEVYALFHGRGPTFFLDGERPHSRTASHSFICLNPFDDFSFKDPCPRSPIPALRRYFSRWKGRQWKEFPHFSGGGVGFLSYDFLNPKASKFLKACLAMVRDLIVFDHKTRSMKLMTSLLPGRDGAFETAYRAACQRIESIRERIYQPSQQRPESRLAISRLRYRVSKEAFRRMVLKAKDYIRVGDIYQANLSQKITFDFKGDSLGLYRRLRALNPSPFSAFLDFGRLKVVSSSPERLIKLTGRHCETRPIAGTRPAGKSHRENRKLSAELLLNEKERAEHLMLLDLERNDLGRVCEYKSVHVDEMMTLERYSHVMHIVSNVSGRLAAGKDRFDLLEAVFPGGTITGCPKIRCMEIIEELEKEPRGLYTGSIGYFDFNGNMDWNIVIRTLVLEGKKAFLQSGAGIVYDSVPEKEYEETLHKAEAFLVALGINHGKHTVCQSRV